MAQSSAVLSLLLIGLTFLASNGAGHLAQSPDSGMNLRPTILKAFKY